MNSELVAAILGGAAVVALFVLLDRAADALRAKHRIPEGGLLGLLWRKITGDKG